MFLRETLARSETVGRDAAHDERRRRLDAQLDHGAVHPRPRPQMRIIRDNKILRTGQRERRGEKIAIVAAARKLMRAVYIMLKEEQAFRLDG